MSATVFNPQEVVRRRLSDADDDAVMVGAAARIEALEAELRRMREEFVKMRELVVEREKKGRTLIGAYREVIADLADLFETLRQENIKRDESLRFFLSSIEGRIKTDIRNELADGASSGSAGGWWPFRRSR